MAKTTPQIAAMGAHAISQKRMIAPSFKPVETRPSIGDTVMLVNDTVRPRPGSTKDFRSFRVKRAPIRWRTIELMVNEAATVKLKASP